MMRKRVLTKKIAAFSVASLFLLTAIAGASTQQNLVQGHVSWTYLSEFDNCFAAVAGLASNRVLWFNDQVLVENFALGDKWVYVTEAGAPDPRIMSLAPTRNFTFDDPNGVWWNVTESQYFVGASTAGTRTPQVVDNGAGNAEVHGREHARAGPYYVWTVKLLQQPAEDRAAGNHPHFWYNFVVLVDTCKFLRGGDKIDHPGHNHPAVSEMHEHTTFKSDIWLGGKPDDRGVFIPVGQPGASYEQKGSNNGQTYPVTP